MLSIAYSDFGHGFEEICMDCLPPYCGLGTGRRRAGRRPSLGGLTSKARMSFRMNRMAFGTVPYCGFGYSPKESASKVLLRCCCEQPGDQQITRPYFQAGARHLPLGFEKHRSSESIGPRVDIRAGSVIKKAAPGTALHETLGNESGVRLSCLEFVADLSKAQAPPGFHSIKEV